jgi:Tol biopolymer transport system component
MMAGCRRSRRVGAAAGVACGVLLVATPALAGDEATTMQVDVGLDGPANEPSSISPSISADGRFVAFVSRASNLVEGDTDRTNDAFVRDLETGTLRLVSDSSFSSVYPEIAISADGRHVAFKTGPIWVKDLVTDETERVTVDMNGAGSYGSSASISADGRHVAFVSDAWNLVRGDTNNNYDVFVRDLEAGVTRRLSVGWTGAEPNGESLAPSISADGRFVAFLSGASNLVRRDTNRRRDLFVTNVMTGRTRLVSVGANRTQGDGRSGHPSISADGRFVAYSSRASNLVEGGSDDRADIFVHNLGTGKTRLASVGANGAQANRPSRHTSISANGRFVAFSSRASNLVKGDTNDSADIFVRDLGAGDTQLVSLDADGVQRSRSSSQPAISAGGRYVAFVWGAAYGHVFRRGPLR